MGKFWGTASLVIIGILTPLTLLIAISQNAVPGDLFYPVKRGIEGVVLAAASVNPTTKALFKTDLSGRRFTEAYKLLARADTSGLDLFVDEIETTKQAIITIADSRQKQQLQTKLVAKINEYQVKLAQVQTSLTPQTTSTSQSPQQIQQAPQQITPQANTQTSSQTTTSQPTQPAAAQQASGQVIPTQPPLAPPQLSPAARDVTVSKAATSTAFSQAISHTQNRLDRIKKELEEKEHKEKKEKKEKDRDNDNKGKKINSLQDSA